MLFLGCFSLGSNWAKIRQIENKMAEQVDIPLESHDDETSKLNDPSVPPEYQSPKIDFNEGWKDRGFAIIFFLYLIAVMITSLVLGIPAIQSYAEHMKHHGKPTLFDINKSKPATQLSRVSVSFANKSKLLRLRLCNIEKARSPCKYNLSWENKF